jgi:hypothetical protein
VRINGAIALRSRVAILPHHPAEPDLRGRKGKSDDHNRDQKLAIKGWSMLGNSRWKPPLTTHKQEY